MNNDKLNLEERYHFNDSYGQCCLIKIENNLLHIESITPGVPSIVINSELMTELMPVLQEFMEKLDNK